MNTLKKSLLILLCSCLWLPAAAQKKTISVMEIKSEIDARMTRYVASAKSHLGHRYSLADFGLPPLKLEGLDEAMRTLTRES